MTDAPKRRAAQPIKAEVRAALAGYELQGLCAEAFEAYDMQDERVRFDTLNRRWVFVPVKRDDQSELMLKVQRGLQVAEDYISTAQLAAEIGKARIVDVIHSLDASVL